MAEEEKKKTIWEKRGLEAINAFADEYKAYMSVHKTERENVQGMEEGLKKAGAYTLDEVKEKKISLKPGDLVYDDMMKKSLMIVRIGRKPITDGARLLGAHIDSPRLDLKQHPLYEDTDMAFFDTHYYGGIKKYQWVTLPMALHGVIAKKDGTVVNVCVGEDPSDPVFGVSDLLIHLASKQMSKKASEVIEGENLNILIGSRPLEGKEKDAVKAEILSLLREKYDVTEDDLVSAEIEVVPAGAARDYGLDRSMVMCYGQDDKVCAYPSYRAVMDEKNPEYTSICLLTDKEEIGSVGATGMHSRFFENTLAEIMNALGVYSELELRRTLTKIRVLSSDVSAGFDPTYPDVMDKNNCAYLGRGPVFNKYTGSRGKSGSNDANAEYIAFLRGIMDKEDISCQTAELGKVDAGGGGTIAYILANLGMQVIDFGVPVLNMHAPWEITSKADIYETYLAYRAFVK
ncbi:MAG: aminopeptidase [Lachnospiraceae bacterium]|nr:aminopeptidase [Lachnospiraceae bacterium]